MSTDLRGFQYAAEPVLRRRQWDLDAVVAEMGRTLARIAQAREHAATLQEQLVAQAAVSNGAAVARLDPAAHARSLAWLTQMQGRIAEAERVLRQLEEQRDDVTVRLRASQADVEAIEAHREDAVRDFAADAASRQAAEADRDWLARRAAESLNRIQS